MGIFSKTPATVEITELPKMFEGKEATATVHMGFHYEEGVLTLLKKESIFYSAPVNSYQLLYADNSRILLCADGLPKSLALIIDKKYVREFHMLKFLLQRDAKNLNLSYMKACMYVNKNFSQTSPMPANASPTPTNTAGIPLSTSAVTAPTANASGTISTTPASAVPDNFIGYTSDKIQFIVSGDRLRLEKKGKIYGDAPLNEYKILHKKPNAALIVYHPSFSKSIPLYQNNNYQYEFQLLCNKMEKYAEILDLPLFKAIQYIDREKTYDTATDAMKAVGFYNPLSIGENKKIDKRLSPHEKIYFASKLEVGIFNDPNVLNASDWWKINGRQWVNFVVTNQRVFCLHSFLGKETSKEILLDRIDSIDEATNRIFTSKMRIRSNTQMFIIYSNKLEQSRIRNAIDEARNNQKAVKVVMDAPSSAQTSNVQQNDPLADIQRLHDMLQKGIITQEEFDNSKKQLLTKI